MRGPIDTQLNADSHSGQMAKAIKSAEKPPEGKAFKRLQLFNEERGLPTVQENEMEKAPIKNARKGSRKLASPGEGTPAEEYASEMLAAATALLEHQPLEKLQPAKGMNSAGPLSSPPTGVGPQWEFIGPLSISNGQTYGESRVVVSGRISCIAVNPTNSNHILCGSAGGGVWESRNRGVNWAPRTDYMATLTVGALAFDPSATSIVYCGTGEGNFYGGLGTGLLKSTNGGTSWAILATAPFMGQGFYDLIVDRANSNHLLGATTGGLYESSNGGVAWSLRRGGICWDIAMNPLGGASSEVLAALQDGIYQSNNGGTTYAKINLPGAPASFNRLAVDISRSNPSVAFVYGAGAPLIPVPGGRPTDRMPTPYIWRRTAVGGAFVAVPPPAGIITTQAWYDWYLAIAPDNPGQIYLGAIEAYRGTLTGTSWAWVMISNKTGDDIHPDQHAIAFDSANANIIYAGCDGGLFTSPNRGTNWTSLNNGLGITEIEYLAQDIGSSTWLLAGTQDNGSIRYTGSAGWEHVADGDGGDCGSNRTNPNIVYHSYYGMGMDRSTVKGNFGSFGWIGPNVPTGYNALFYPPMEVANNTVAQAGQSVFISRNQGTTWTEVGLPGGAVGAAMYMPNGDTVFVGATNGAIFRLRWSGTAWSAATALTTPRSGANVSDIFADPNNLNRLWATYSTMGGNRVFRSDNGGTSWVNCTVGLPALPINAIEIHPGNANRIWVAADVGVYQSFDAGATWSAFANGLPNCLAVDLLYHPHARKLRVGTRNRGVWEINVDGRLTSPICGLQFNGTLTPNQTQKWFSFNWPATWHMLWTVMPTNFLPGAPQITWKVQVERGSSEFVTYWIVVTNLTNQPVNFEGRYCILSYS